MWDYEGYYDYENGLYDYIEIEEEVVKKGRYKPN